jgi:hypothetical protein
MQRNKQKNTIGWGPKTHMTTKMTLENGEDTI